MWPGAMLATTPTAGLAVGASSTSTPRRSRSGWTPPHAKIRADVAFDRLVAMGFTGDERTVRRAVAEAKAAYAVGHRRTYRPWIPEPGMWLQYDWGWGPVIELRQTFLFCAWLAWSRYRVIIPTWDRTLGTVLACLDNTLRRLGGAPTNLLTDNEQTLTSDRVAGVPVRHPDLVAAGRHYGLKVETCVPHDPQTKGGSEATVRLAKADLVPTEANLLPAYANRPSSTSVRVQSAGCAAPPPVASSASGRKWRERSSSPPSAVASLSTRRSPWPLSRSDSVRTTSPPYSTTSVVRT